MGFRNKLSEFKFFIKVVEISGIVSVIFMLLRPPEDGNVMKVIVRTIVMIILFRGF